jgi:hypothetical protein
MGLTGLLNRALFQQNMYNKENSLPEYVGLFPPPTSSNRVNGSYAVHIGIVETKQTRQPILYVHSSLAPNFPNVMIIDKAYKTKLDKFISLVDNSQVAKKTLTFEKKYF